MLKTKLDKKNFPLCEAEIDLINNQFISNGWLTLYATNIFAVMIKKTYFLKSKKHESWDLRPCDSHPTINEFGSTASGYRRFYEKGIEPIVIYREQKGTHSQQICFSEEFVLFYDLREVRENENIVKYMLVDECGDDNCIAQIENSKALVQLKYIKEFLAVKQMNLLIQFEYIKHSNKTLSQIGVSNKYWNTIKNNEYVLGYSVLNSPCPISSEDLSFAMIRGKVWFEYDDSDIKMLWNYHDTNTEEFIIGVDENGDNIECTCDENKLPNLFNRKDAEPYVLTPVFFKKEVLQKYYSEPNKFSVNEGFINGPEWWLRIDNDRKDNYIVATLVDLGKIPYKEQQYWRSFNITPPPMAELSETTKRRWFDGEACNTCDAQDFLFKQTLLEVNNLWNKKNNWQLFKPLTKGDEHHIASLHTMFSQNNNLEFDGLIQSITKIVIDSLNEKEIIKNTDDSMDVVQKFLSEKKCSKASDLKGGIAKFEVYLLSFGYSDTEIIKLMKDIQKLRSTSVAHRKSSKPDNEQQQLFARLGLNNSSQQEVFNNLLSNLTLQLNWLKENLIDN